MKENDCISRKRAIERLKLNLPISQGADNSRDRHRYMQAMADIQAIRELPSVTPQEPKIGYWIEGQTDNPNIHNILCSCCFEGYPSKGHANSQYTREKFKYCPNCGCRMVEPQESEG